ncbi:MAG: hypothetical protein ACHRHE_19650 [Tepidisphaerales bacterium]
MMNRCLWNCTLAMAMSVAGAVSARAEGPATRPAEPERIRKLISTLGAEEWRDRQAAEDELEAMGLAIRPALTEALARSTDTEARMRLESILRQIADRAATGPTLITLHLKGALPRQAFDEFFQQAGATLRVVPDNLWDSRPFSPADVDIEAQPYWVALPELCKTYDVQVQNAGDRDVSVVDKTSQYRLFGKAPRVVHGPFMVIAQSVSRSQWAELNFNQNVSKHCAVQLIVLAEPKLRVLQGAYVAHIDEAVDENGNSLLMPAAQQIEGVQRLTGCAWNLQATLKPADPLGDRIARLSGTARYWIQTRSEKTEIANLAEAKDRSQQVGGRAFVVKELKKQGEMWQIKLSFSRFAWGGADMGSLQDPNGSTIRLLDADGRTLPRIGGVATNFTADNMMEMLFSFGRPASTAADKVPDPAKLVVEIPTEMKEMTVPFEFTDLPMP